MNPEPQNFDTNLTTHIIVHGYVGHVNFSATANIYKAFLRRGGSNVLAVDWGRLATAPCYPAAVFNTLQAGRCTGEFLVALARRVPQLSLARVHAVGFSLGAHVAAFASNAVHEATGARLGRITGLDPALPLFATLKKTWKLDASDADFVDVLHTNVGVFGKIEAVGHADFYFNGGTVQPACSDHQNVPLCSHLLANIYFAESIESDIGFWGTHCPSYYQYVVGWCSVLDSGSERVIVGEHCNSSTRGVYFVETGSTPPYALG
ncbi:hypothetical protein R5R35_012521 [Gryllus longicercus]